MRSSVKVSVVISTFNRCDKLRRAIDSVLAQSFKDIEIIVVDNASTDQTTQMIKEITDERIQYVRHSSNLGGPAARNTGIRMARADLVAFLDDDDEFKPEKLEKQVRKMQESEARVGLIYAGAEIFDEKQGRVTLVNPPRYKGNVYERLLLSTILSSVSSVLVKKECLNKVGAFDETLTSCQDWDMWLRIAKEYEFDYVDETLVRINMHGEQISTNYAALIPGRTRMVRKHEDEFRKHPDIYVVHLKRIGKLHCINGTWALAREWFAQAIAVRPLEALKIFVWCVWELPRVKYFSPAKVFKRYRP